MASSDPTASKRPNILLVLTDQQRFDTIQALGSKFAAKTPAMDALVRDGVNFDNAFCTAPVCSPSRATLMTGLFPSQAGVPGNLNDPSPPLSPGIMSVGKRLQQAGYETAYHGKWHLGGDIHDHGFEVTEKEQSLDEATRLHAAQFWRSRDWLDNAHRPFFHVVSFLNPHDLHFYDMAARVPGFSRPWPKDGSKLSTAPAGRQVDWPEERWGAYTRFYEEMIERADRDMAELLHQFRCSGYFSNSWIIFAADHGDMCGEHDLPFKGPWMYDGVTHVPLVIVPPRAERFSGPGVHRVADPGITPGRRSHLVSLLDIVPTILDLAEIAPAPELPGRSLLPIVRGNEASAVHPHVFSEWAKPPVRMCRSLEWKYVLYLNGDEELFYLADDPDELRNLAADTAHAAAKKQMRATLEEHFTKTRDPFHALSEHDFIYNAGQDKGKPLA